MTQLAIDMPCSDRRISPGVPGAAVIIFANHSNRCVKLPISDMPDIGNFICDWWIKSPGVLLA